MSTVEELITLIRQRGLEMTNDGENVDQFVLGYLASFMESAVNENDSFRAKIESRINYLTGVLK